MKQKLIFFFIIIISFAFFSCEDDTNLCTDDSSQVLIVYADNNKWPEQKHTVINGLLTGTPLPEFIYLKNGDSVFHADDYSTVFSNYVVFGEYDFQSQLIKLDSIIEKLSIEVKTSHGKINGSVDLPDKITSIVLSEYDTLQVGESFTMSWTGSNADFYAVEFYFYHGKNAPLSGIFVKGNSITLSTTTLLPYERIIGGAVRPVNGPFPQNGNNGNMTGVGEGFLYYFSSNKGWGFDNKKDIIIAKENTDGKIKKTSIQRPKQKLFTNTVKERIENIILGKENR